MRIKADYVVYKSTGCPIKLDIGLIAGHNDRSVNPCHFALDYIDWGLIVGCFDNERDEAIKAADQFAARNPGRVFRVVSSGVEIDNNGRITAFTDDCEHIAYADIINQS